MSPLSSGPNDKPRKNPAELCFPSVFTLVSLLALFFEPEDGGDMFL
jgi:hypothetical protein